MMNETKSNKNSYKDRKLLNRLRKYETIIKNAENINRLPVDSDSQILFVGNGGLDNNVSYDDLSETFGFYGSIIDVLMPLRKSYSFIIYQDPASTRAAINHLQNQPIESSPTPICFYLFPVDRLPNESNDDECNDFKPEGLVYLKDYIDDRLAERILSVIGFDEVGEKWIDLKNRLVRHFGYEFRYGSNDCDPTNPLMQYPIPDVIRNELIARLVLDKLIDCEPDQMTVNFYQPGNGIPPHTDNCEAFGDYIISLSLLSSVQMEFRLRGEESTTNRLFKLNLEPNSLLILKDQSRYKWTHSIAERKHDLISVDNHIHVQKRSKRISLTFRKVKLASSSFQISINCNNNYNEKMTETTTTEKEKSSSDIILPANEKEAIEFEKSYVHKIYNEIADHFSHTRHSPWPGVVKFIDSMEPNASMLDIGCGNGKYLNLRNDLVSFGCDYSDQLISICKQRQFNCFVSDCLNLFVRENYFDYAISIAVLHHLSTQERRTKALLEMKRVLKPGGRGLVTVWAKEQKYKNKESFYIKNKKSHDNKAAEKEGEEGEEGKEESKRSRKLKEKQHKEQMEQNRLRQLNEDESLNKTPVHKFGKEFEKKDVFVAWHYNPKTSNKKEQAKNESAATTAENEESSKKVYLRFYHVFESQELENLFQSVPDVKIIDSYYEEGNWCAIFEKIK